ncbi:MAG: sensor histidine kinase [Microbacterium gubbeenense]
MVAARLAQRARRVPGLVISAMAQLDFDGGSMAGGIVALSVGAVAAGVGTLVRDRVRVGAALDKERQLGLVEQERRLVAEERQRIARELHDVVAHGLSLIQIQATSAPYRVTGVTPEAAAEFADIARSARGSLAEMRQLLGALRGDDEPAERAPQPTVGDIPALVGETRRAGANITLAMPEGTEAPPAQGIAAYRIVQEAISNAMRHAPGARIDVVVDVIGGVLAIDIANDAPETPPAQSRPGHGLVGMRERATILGGSLDAARTNDGGFRVLARLPLGAHGEESR